jgi:hypothetical protein
VYAESVKEMLLEIDSLGDPYVDAEYFSENSFSVE